jgi:hypothetical protein
MSYQLSGEQLRQINEILLAASKTAPVWRVSVEGEVAHPNPGATFNPLKLSRYLNGERAALTLAVCDPHGLSMEWKQRKVTNSAAKPEPHHRLSAD